MSNKIPGNVQEHSGKGLRRFQGMLKKIPGNVRKDSKECLRRLREMFEKIAGNCRFSHAGNWELVKSIVGTKFRRIHVCLHSQARNKL